MRHTKLLRAFGVAGIVLAMSAMSAYAAPVIHGGSLLVEIAQADALTDCLTATVLVRV